MMPWERVEMCGVDEIVYTVVLVDDVTQVSRRVFESTDRFTCEVFIDHHIYDIPKSCHYKIREEF